MLVLLADPDQAARRGQALRRRAIEKYSWADAAHRIIEIYDSLMPGNRGTRDQGISNQEPDSSIPDSLIP
jgi:hypothetical protein